MKEVNIVGYLYFKTTSAYISACPGLLEVETASFPSQIEYFSYEVEILDFSAFKYVCEFAQFYSTAGHLGLCPGPQIREMKYDFWKLRTLRSNLRVSLTVPSCGTPRSDSRFSRQISHVTGPYKRFIEAVWSIFRSHPIFSLTELKEGLHSLGHTLFMKGKFYRDVFLEIGFLLRFFNA